MTRLMLGMLDKAQLRLGDNNIVNFERTLIFMTSNVGAQKMQRTLAPSMGFHAGTDTLTSIGSRLQSVAMHAARRSFAPEFLNRIDETLTYQPLSQEVLETILDIQLRDFQQHLNHRLGARAFHVDVPAKVRRFLLRSGCSIEYGAREIRRAVHRHVAQPVAAMVVSGQYRPGGVVRIDVPDDCDDTTVRPLAA
jgi:ATP-dependent Clp protease ATP-binding subunit ClpA